MEPDPLRSKGRSNRDVTRNNYYVDRRTVYHGNNQRPHTSAATNVRVSNQKYVNHQKYGTNQAYPNKKKKHYDSARSSMVDTGIGSTCSTARHTRI